MAIRTLTVDDREGIINLIIKVHWLKRQDMHYSMSVLAERLKCGQIIGEVTQNNRVRSILLWTLTDPLRLEKIVNDNGKYIPPANTGDITFVHALIREKGVTKRKIFELVREMIKKIPDSKRIYYFRRKNEMLKKLIRR